MKIAFLSAAQSSHTIKWVNALSQKGHDVRLYTLPNHAGRPGEIDRRVRTVALRRGGFAGYFLNAGQLRRELDDFAPDIVNAHYASGYGTLARLSRVHPLLLSVWGSDVYSFPDKSPLHKKLVADNLNAADAIASTSGIMAGRTKKLLSGEKRIFITPFGVDCALFAPVKHTGKGFTVGAMKALEPPYGLEDLVWAFSLFRKAAPDVDATLEIYGKGSLAGKLQQMIDGLGLSDRAFLRGAVPNEAVPGILGGMDVVCLPSLEESFGVSAVEAMACGIPVVTSDADGFLETVEADVTGFIVPKKQPGAVAQKLCELAADPELRRRLGEAGRKRVLERYDFSKNVETMEQAYRSVIQSYEEK